MDFKEIIKSKDYDFLRENEHLGDKLILLNVGGSHAYGTDVPTSDIDIRGCALNSPSDILGLSSFDNFENSATDTTIYSFNKLVSLLSNTNPNTIEMLGCKPEHYIYVSPIGQELIDNVDLFLSQKASKSFGGYATHQLRRLQNAVARDAYTQTEKEKHTMETIENMMNHFNEHYTNFGNGSIELYLGDSDKEDLDKEIKVNVSLKDYPLRDYKNIWSEMREVVKSYGKLNHRNRKKDEAHLNKHAMHLVRLFLMCFDILEKGEVITYREEEREELLAIRHGKYMKEDGTYQKEFFEMVDEYEKRLSYAEKNTDLPYKPDYDKIEEFVISVNRRSI